MNENISKFVSLFTAFSTVVGRNGLVHGWLQALDRVLRGEATRPAALKQQSIDVPIVGLSTVLFGLAVSYGVCMGVYSGFHPDGSSYMQWLACTIKVPALFFLTLCVTFPSLYVFNALIGSRLYIGSVLQLLVAALAVNLAVLASLGPVVAFFSFCTTSSPFMVVLNVVVFALSGLLGMVFLLQTLQRLSVMRQMAETPPWVRRQVPQPTPPPTAAAPAGTAPGADQATPAILVPEPPAAGGVADEATPYNLLSPGPLLAEHSPRKFRPMIEPLPEEPSALDSMRGHVLGRHVKTIFVCWMMTFGVVGGQMAWVLRPFFGSGAQDFVWFAPRGSNFFEGVLHAVITLLK
jgi:hypothetical protein